MNSFIGTVFDSGTGNVGSVDLKATLEEARSEFQKLEELAPQQLGDARGGKAAPGDAAPGDAAPELTGLPWNIPKCYISVIGKKEGDLVMSRREVETIKKIKKCGKCFYRIVLTDDGVVSGIRSGDYRESILKFIMLPPLQEPIG